MDGTVRSFLVDCAQAALHAPSAPGVEIDDQHRILDGAQRLFDTAATAATRNPDVAALPLVGHLGPGGTALGDRFRELRDALPWTVSPRGHDPEGTSSGLVLFNDVFDLAPLTVGMMVMAPGSIYPEHSHAPQEFYFIVDGTASWRYGGATTYVDLEPGVTLFNHPNDRHGTVAGDDPLLAMYVLWEGDPT